MRKSPLLAIRSLIWILLGVLGPSPGLAEVAPVFDGTWATISQTRRRPHLAEWAEFIAAYSVAHYGEKFGGSTLRHRTEADPDAMDGVVQGIVLHYTAGRDFPWNLVESQPDSARSVTGPGLACHFVVVRNRVYQLLPLDLRGRCTLGANHTTVSIEIMAPNAATLAADDVSLRTAARLAVLLLEHFQLSSLPDALDRLYSHSEIDALVAKQKEPGSGTGRYRFFWDHLQNGSGKADPGVDNMHTLRALAAVFLADSASFTPAVLARAVACDAGQEVLELNQLGGRGCLDPVTGLVDVPPLAVGLEPDNARRIAGRDQCPPGADTVGEKCAFSVGGTLVARSATRVVSGEEGCDLQAGASLGILAWSDVNAEFVSVRLPPDACPPLARRGIVRRVDFVWKINGE